MTELSPEQIAEWERQAYDPADDTGIDSWIARTVTLIARLAEVERERDELREHLACDLSTALVADGHAGTLTGNLAADMAAYATRLKGRAEQAEAALAAMTAEQSAMLARFGFGDNVTEPQAPLSVFIEYVEGWQRDADEWREHENFRIDCALAGHPEDEDCAEHDPHHRLYLTEAALAAERAKVAEGLAVGFRAEVEVLVEDLYGLVRATDSTSEGAAYAIGALEAIMERHPAIESDPALVARLAAVEAERGAIQAEALEAVADDVRTSPSTRLGDKHPGEVWEAWLRDRAQSLRAASTEGGE